MVIYNKLVQYIGQIIRFLVEKKPDCELLELEACSDRIHMHGEVPPKHSVVEFIRYLKSKSTLMILEICRNEIQVFIIGSHGQEDILPTQLEEMRR